MYFTVSLNEFFISILIMRVTIKHQPREPPKYFSWFGLQLLIKILDFLHAFLRKTAKIRKFLDVSDNLNE